nr:hypothetical protein [Nocardia elegans]
MIARQHHAVSGALGDDHAGRGARRAAGFQGTAQGGDEGAHGGDRARRRVLPQVCHQGRHRHHPSAGGDQAGQHLGMPGAVQRQRRPVGGDGPHRAQDTGRRCRVGAGELRTHRLLIAAAEHGYRTEPA